MAAAPPQSVQMTSTQRQQLLKTCKAALDSFISSSSSFRIVSTVSGEQTLFTATPHQQPRTLFILDSSYNPPSRAHASLVSSAVRAAATTPLDRSKQAKQRYAAPVRLLLLFSTHNADKEAKPAAFEHRLAMMIVFARDLTRTLHAQQQRRTENTPTPPSTETATDQAPPPLIPDIDIGLTTEPYYHAKSAAITASSTPDATTQQPQTQHVHLTGYDTITRIFAPKYYASHTPPLAALDAFFAAGHGFRVTVRPADSNADADTDAETQAQLRWPAEQLGSGALEGQGGRRAWAARVEMVQAVAEGRDVSSTRVREGVVGGAWADVERCCSEGVVAWIREFGLYAE